MSSIVRLVQVVKWPFLMAWSKALFTGIKRAMWYHLDSCQGIECCWLLLDRGPCGVTDQVQLSHA